MSAEPAIAPNRTGMSYDRPCASATFSNRKAFLSFSSSPRNCSRTRGWSSVSLFRHGGSFESCRGDQIAVHNTCLAQDTDAETIPNVHSLTSIHLAHNLAAFTALAYLMNSDWTKSFACGAVLPTGSIPILTCAICSARSWASRRPTSTARSINWSRHD
jgi:hypothetical protein